MTSLLNTTLRRIAFGQTRAPLTHAGTREARVVAVCARKGGVGKTTTAVNIAAGLAQLHDKKVLLVDMDGQGHCASALRGVLRGVTAESVGEILLGKRRDLHEIALPTAIAGLWVTPSDKDLSEAEGVMAGRIGKEFLLRSALKVARTHFDVIVIDCPPNLGNLTLASLMAADWLLMPCDMSTLALEGVEDIMETVATLEDTLGHQLGLLGILRTRYDARNQKVNEAVEAALAQRFGHLVLPTAVPVNTKLAQAQADGVPIFMYDAACRGAEAYAAVVSEVLPRLGA